MDMDKVRIDYAIRRIERLKTLLEKAQSKEASCIFEAADDVIALGSGQLYRWPNDVKELVEEQATLALPELIQRAIDTLQKRVDASVEFEKALVDIAEEASKE